MINSLRQICLDSCKLEKVTSPMLVKAIVSLLETKIIIKMITINLT